MKDNNLRSYSLDFLRIMATVLVVFHHFQQLTGARFSKFNFYNDEKQVFTVLIELFFVLSGYLLATTKDKLLNSDISLFSFMKGKVIRLLPIAAVSVFVYEILMFIVVTFMPDFPSYFAKDINLWGAVITALGLQAGWVFENPFINNPLWYVSVLLFMYIMMFFLTFLAKKISCNPLVLYILITLLGFAVINYDINLPFFNSYMARGYVSFFPGLIFGIYRKNHKINIKDIIISLVIILAFIAMSISHLGYISRGYNYLFILFVAPAFISLFDSDILRKCFKLKLVGFLSPISYGMIVWHIPVFLTIFMINYRFNLGIDFNNYITMLIMTLIVLIYCIFAYYLIERPLVNYCNKIK